MAKVDVVVPCYNYGRFLEACVDSVLKQSLSDVRILIIDDASTDDSAMVARRIAAADDRVSVSVHETNQGHIKTYNEGIDWAESEYFLLLSADDLLVEGALERAAAIMDANPDVVLTYGTGIPWVDSRPLPVVEPQERLVWSKQDIVREMCAVGANIVDTPTAIGRRSVQQAVGGYRATLPHSGDMEMWLRFGVHGAVGKIEAAQAIYRRHSSNMSHSYLSKDWSDYPHRKAAFDSFFETYAALRPEFPSLKRQAYHAVAETVFWCAIGRIRRGYIRNGIQLLRFSTDLNPRLRFGPTGGSIIRYASSKVFGR